jgi:hypothetical protein
MGPDEQVSVYVYVPAVVTFGEKAVTSWMFGRMAVVAQPSLGAPPEGTHESACVIHCRKKLCPISRSVPLAAKIRLGVT